MAQIPQGSGLAVDVLPMADLHHKHYPQFILNRVDNTVRSASDPIPVASCQLSAPQRSGVVGQSLNVFNQVSPELPSADGLQFLQRRGLDEDFISCHSASSP